MREEVIAPQVEAEYLWQKAISLGVERAILNEPFRYAHQLFGRVVEYLGYAMAQEEYPRPDYEVISPGRMADLRRDIPKKDRDRWQLSIPDGLIFKREDRFMEGTLELYALLEYKATRWRNLNSLRTQFDGFVSLGDFFKQNDGARGRQVLKKVLGQEADLLLIPSDIKFVYVKPYDESVRAIPTSLYGLEHLEEVPLPLSVSQIWERINKVKSGT